MPNDVKNDSLVYLKTNREGDLYNLLGFQNLQVLSIPLLFLNN